MNKYWRHFCTITKHKWVVMKLCFKCGLLKRGLLHDLSKYGITEFCSSAKYFQGDKSPIDAEKMKKGYSLAWQHHKGHNPHHWEYWIDNVGTRRNDAIEIPYEYVVEMVCDWVGAGIVYSKQKPDYSKPYKEPFDYYKTHLSERIFNVNTQELLEFFLWIISTQGINAFCKIARNEKNVRYFVKNRIHISSRE